MQRFARLWPYQACACLGTTGAALYRHSLLETIVKFTQIKIKKLLFASWCSCGFGNDCKK